MTSRPVVGAVLAAAVLAALTALVAHPAGGHATGPAAMREIVHVQAVSAPDTGGTIIVQN